MFPLFQSHSITIDFSIEPSILMGNIICSFISLVSCIAMIILFIKKPRIRSLIHTIVICIAISESIINIGHLFSIVLLIQTNVDLYIDSVLCDIQSVLIVYGETATMVFFTIMAYCIYVYIIQQHSSLHLRKKKIILLGIIVSSVITLIIMTLYLLHIKVIAPNKTPIQRDVYMKWCWIKNNDHNLFLYIYLGLHLLMMLYILIIVSFVYYSITVRVNEMDTRKRKNNLKQTSRKLVAYPIIGAFGWVFTFVTNILPFNNSNFASSGNNSLTRLKFQFLAVDGMYMCLKGFFIALLFFSSDKIKTEMQKIFGMVKRLIQKIHQGQVNDFNTSMVSSEKKEGIREQISSNFTYNQTLFNHSN